MPKSCLVFSRLKSDLELVLEDDAAAINRRTVIGGGRPGRRGDDVARRAVEQAMPTGNPEWDRVFNIEALPLIDLTARRRCA